MRCDGRVREARWAPDFAEALRLRQLANWINRFQAEVEVIEDTIRKKMWDEKAGLFMDLDPDNRRKTNVKAAVGFYPLATDIPPPKMVERMLETLGDRKEFWTKYPVPSVAISDTLSCVMLFETGAST